MISDIDPWHMSLRRPFGKTIPTGRHELTPDDPDEETVEDVAEKVEQKVVERPAPKSTSKTTGAQGK
ncbi:hypothetical protein EF294_03455 [Gordonia oryzae]|uniref:Uncharacterized protein n=1 Tax=Gordonia oryzae TaxID=2487349 RepID=A0A3N4GYL2_9ACTN|nr:hypothetical protein [Gordonia oryzae]RPA65806.1 hypothetical protein EF294_03455 [Gordonia oryzae]